MNQKETVQSLLDVETALFAVVGAFSLLPYLLIPLAYLSRVVDFNVDGLAWIMGALVAASLVGAFVLLLFVSGGAVWLRWIAGDLGAAREFLKIGTLRYAPLFVAAQLEIYIGLKTNLEGVLPILFGAAVLAYAWFLFRRDRQASLLPRLFGLDSIQFPL